MNRHEIKVNGFYLVDTTANYYTERTVLYKNERYSIKNIIDNGGLVFVLRKGFTAFQVYLYYKGEFLNGEDSDILVLENEFIKINTN